MSGSITNVHGLPTALVEAVKNDPYVGGGDISVTKLIDAPQRRVLWKKHATAVETDVSERIWSLLGQAVHHILERAGTDALAEERLFADIGGWQVSGQFDRLHLGDRTLQDYKVTTTYKADGNEQWTRQLNVLRWLAYRNNYDVDHLEIVAIFRDWRKVEADRKPDYPRAAVQVIPVPVWPLSVTEMYVRERVLAHQNAEKGMPTSCSDEERWYSGDRWAIQKPGAKRALRVLDEKPDEVPDGYDLMFRKGEFKRCAHYCEVSAFCPQWAADRPATPDPSEE
jgi:hypothetical protein